MMWHVLYYESVDGKCPVKEFIDSVSERNQAKTLALFAALEERGPNLPRPYADLLKDGIHELRVNLSGKQVRVFYFFCYRDFIVLTNVLMKTTAKVPESEINNAKKCRDDFLKRIDEETLRELIR
jgi:hypothetical protein